MISVVIPAYNESEIIGKVIGELKIELNKKNEVFKKNYILFFIPIGTFKFFMAI